MMIKIFSLLILAYSLFMIGGGLYCLPATNNIAGSLELFISSETFKEIYNLEDHVEFDAHDWKLHWVSQIIIGIIFGILGVINSIGMFKRLEWARKLFLAQISVGLFIEVAWYLSGLAKYTWEITSKLELITYTIIFILSWFFLCRKSVILEFKKK